MRRRHIQKHKLPFLLWFDEFSLKDHVWFIGPNLAWFFSSTSVCFLTELTVSVNNCKKYDFLVLEISLHKEVDSYCDGV